MVPPSDLDNSEQQDVSIPAGEVMLQGTLAIPEGARAIVLFAHGSGSGRFSPRNRFVASYFNDQGIATQLIDLLTPDEEAIDLRTRHLRFDINLLAERLTGVADWISQNKAMDHLAVGIFGSSTGAAAALVAAAQRPDLIQAVVSRGGRPDLASHILTQVQAPTLLIIGDYDIPVIGMNREALSILTGEKRLEIVPGATHLFEEPGALEAVAHLASDWFSRYLMDDSQG
jgi:putative phosphoribosyl transferase